MERPQTVSAPEADDLARMKARRASVHAYAAPESRASLEAPAGKLGLIRALLTAGVFQPEQTTALQSLGIVLGDALVRHVDGAEWVMVEDEYGRDPGYDAVSRGLTDAFECSPLSCNHRSVDFAVNADCLLPHLAAAIAAAEDFSRGNAEPGTYYVVEVWSEPSGGG